MRSRLLVGRYAEKRTLGVESLCGALGPGKPGQTAERRLQPEQNPNTEQAQTVWRAAELLQGGKGGRSPPSHRRTHQP